MAYVCEEDVDFLCMKAVEVMGSANEPQRKAGMHIYLCSYVIMELGKLREKLPHRSSRSFLLQNHRHQ